LQKPPSDPERAGLGDFQEAKIRFLKKAGKNFYFFPSIFGLP
jgi:hypothetical protein